MGQFLQRLPLLFVAAVLLVSSAAKSTEFTSALLAAGLVVLGAWIGVEVVRLREESFREERGEALPYIEDNNAL